MKMECKFLSNPELNKDGARSPPEHQNSFILLPYEKKTTEKIGDLKMTCFYGVMNGTGVGNEISSGRFGTVYIGTKVGTFDKVAIKEYHLTFHEAIVTGMNEGSPLHFLFSIRHPFIMETYTVDIFRDICYSVTELAQRTVHDDVAEKGKYNETKAKEVLKQVISAVEFLHSQGIFHGSLHTKNLLICDNTSVKVSDVATSQLLQWLPYRRTPLDILHFIAPELYNSLSNVTSQSDLWSLGVCLFVMATATTPFMGSSRQKLEKSIQNGNFRAPFTISSDLQILLKAMLLVDISQRCTVSDVINSKWMTSEGVPLNTMEERQKHLLRKKAEAEESCNEEAKVDTEESSQKSEDEGYVSISSDELPPKKNGDEDVEPAVDPLLLLPHKTSERFHLMVMDNVRQEWDPNVTRVEKCHLSNGERVLRVVLPVTEETDAAANKAHAKLSKALRRLKHTPVDAHTYKYGDYALMNFRRDNIGIEPFENLPKYFNSKQSSKIYCKQEAQRLWDQLNVVICERCHTLGTDSNDHTKNSCIYKYWSEATVTNEIIFVGDEDQYNLRSVKLTFRHNGLRPGRFSRFRRQTTLLINRGISGIRNVMGRGNQN